MTAIGSTTINRSYVNEQAGFRRTDGGSTNTDADFPKDIENENQKSRSSNSSRANAASDIQQNGIFQGTTVSLKSVIDDMPSLYLGAIWEMPDELYQGTVEVMKGSLKTDYTQINEASDWKSHPTLQKYATIVKDGEVVAEITNQGLVRTTDETLYNEFRSLIEGAYSSRNRSGPEAADELAQKLASRFGGTLVISDTAITQSEFETLPDLQIYEHVLDRQAMEADPRFQMIQELMQNRANYLEQQQNSVDTNT